MTGVNAAELAKVLSVSPPRISQLLSEGKLEGCYQGAGRARRFDPVACAHALGRRLDPGQRMGNGAGTQRAAAKILADQTGSAEEVAPAPVEPVAAAAVTESQYELARTAKAQEEARRMRRVNLEAEGTYVLADAVERQVRRQLGQEVAETQVFLRALARTVADEYQLDAKVVRKLMLDAWREHRGARADAAETVERDAPLADDEAEADV